MGHVSECAVTLGLNRSDFAFPGIIAHRPVYDLAVASAEGSQGNGRIVHVQTHRGSLAPYGLPNDANALREFGTFPPQSGHGSFASEPVGHAADVPHGEPEGFG
jgi:hypothetical protein